MAHQNRMPAVDGLRGLAALAVVLYHYEGVAFGTPRHDRFFKLGELGVELFFIISGFVILLSLDKGQTIKQFALSRFTRLYPAYWFSLLIAGAALLAAGKFKADSFIVNTTMLQSFVGVRDAVEPYWTLGYELWFYLAMSAVAFFGHLRSITRIALFWLALCTLFKVVGYWWPPAAHPAAWNLVIKVFRPDYFQFFAAGIAICQIVNRRDVVLSWLLLVAAVLYTLFGHVGGTPPLTYFSISALCAAAVLLAAKGRLPMLETRVFVTLGAWSYSIYLLHLPIARLLAMGAQSLGLAPVVGVIIAVPVCLAMAAAVREWIEKPALAWGRSVRQSRLTTVGT
jgi:peptidoglycan/LPS O-acetylase OafA/YrhL